ncbi:hypothetical protein BJ546DRAFT_597475 [Cryomyces antarcticus]
MHAELERRVLSGATLVQTSIQENCSTHNSSTAAHTTVNYFAGPAPLYTEQYRVSTLCLRSPMSGQHTAASRTSFRSMLSLDTGRASTPSKTPTMPRTHTQCLVDADTKSPLSTATRVYSKARSSQLEVPRQHKKQSVIYSLERSPKRTPPPPDSRACGFTYGSPTHHSENHGFWSRSSMGSLRRC